jgi:hypothetical protein
MHVCYILNRDMARSICWDKISLDLKFVDWPTHENHENSCPTNYNDFTVFFFNDTIWFLNWKCKALLHFLPLLCNGPAIESVSILFFLWENMWIIWIITSCQNCKIDNVNQTDMLHRNFNVYKH